MKIQKTFAWATAACMALSLAACGASNTAEGTTQEKAGGLFAGAIQKTIYHKGDTAEGRGFKLTVNSVDATPEFENYEDADNGTEYFFVSFELENTSNSDLEVNDFFSITADGEDCETIKFYIGDYDGVDWLSQYESVAAGRKIKNYISAVVPERWNEIQLACKDGTTFSFAHTDLGVMSAAEDSGQDVIYHVGDTFTRGGMQITMKKAVQTDYVSDNSYSHYEPDAGKEFVILFFDIKNNSDRSQKFSVTSTFDVFIDDYTDCFTGLSSTKIDNVEGLTWQDTKDILPGKSMSGYAVVQVPTNWEKLELVNRQGTFEVTPDTVKME